ncbi:hypothetical protein GH714_001002 [Hevea brasiliensis]|uniref:Reverse transcriptase Ty1/copia-type domain-containing protein n=1 Tax=Hevea brasiliensis TaxID=3981 RepID=A0A6A6NA06_HEVBR|nr:hypothetical protein GH714_001002 [Hevea brasiliensis]
MNSSIVANTLFSALEPHNSIVNVSNADDITRACQSLDGVELTNIQYVVPSESMSISHAESDSHMPSMSIAIPSSATHISKNSNDNAHNPLGFQQSTADHSAFIFSRGSSYVAILIYVDDIIVTGTDLDRIAKLKCYLDDKFHIKDLGKLKYFLGIKVARSSKGIALSQRKYTLNIWPKVDSQVANPFLLPWSSNISFLLK